MPAFLIVPSGSIGAFSVGLLFFNRSSAALKRSSIETFPTFGFGRAFSDACIDIRRGALDRKQALSLVKTHDGIFPHEYLKDYLDYYDMSEEEFWKTVDSFRSSDVWEKVNGKWKLKFEIK